MFKRYMENNRFYRIKSLGTFNKMVIRGFRKLFKQNIFVHDTHPMKNDWLKISQKLIPFKSTTKFWRFFFS
jgi:hypothetical protein